MPFRTKLTETLGIVHPIIQGGMQWVGTAEMASAVSNAGALGILTALTQPTPEALQGEIERCRSMTSKPFGVNLTFLPAITPPPYEQYVQVIIGSGVKIVETAGNNPGQWVKMLKDAGVFVIHKCTAIRHALKAEKLGVDMVSIDGFECAGHPGEDDIPNMVLLNRAAETLSIPFVASGGLSNGRSLAAALALGAVGINMGTRFMCTVEAPIHQNVKEAIVQATELDTTLMFRTLRNTARVFKNDVSKQVFDIEKANLSSGQQTDFNQIKDLVSGKRGRRVFTEGDINAGVWTAGTVVGLIHDIPTCKDLVETIVRDAEEILSKRLQSCIVPAAKL